MDIPRALRKELDALSKEVLGTSGKWKKILDNGTKELVMTTKVETIPADEKTGMPETTKETQVPVLTTNGVKQWYQKYYTLNEIHARLLELRVKRNEMLAMMKKQQEEQVAKKAQEAVEKQVKEVAHGSAL
jgi:hypothetical protein